MTKTRRSTALVATAAAALVVCLLALVAARPADAAFPGQNGKIAYNRAFDYWSQDASAGSPETKLVDTAASLTFSPDGSRVAFIRQNEIYVARADGSGTPRNITNSPLLDLSPAWSHDGTRIVFVRRGTDNVFSIWRINADGTDPNRLTAQTGGTPAWSVPTATAPDGRIVFVRDGRLWTMLPDGTNQAELQYPCPTLNGGVCDRAVGNPTFSPDGSQIAAEYFGNIFVVPSGGGASRVILGTPQNGYPGQELDPAWSPDGEQIAFEHNGNVGGSAYGIYVANADGSSAQAVRVTAKTGEVDPDWQPVVPSLRINDVRVRERNAAARFTVSLSVASQQPVTVDYATADGTAKAPADYAATTGTLTFAPGETSKTVPVAVRSDRKNEPNETFSVNLSNASTTIADASGKGTIVDHD